MSPLLLLISPLLCLSHLTTAVLSSPLPRVPNQHSIPLSDTEPALPKCTYYTVTQPLNHFGPSPGDFEQRLCIVDEYFDASSSIPPTVFFYVGNESPVEEYVNNTGLMYTLAPDFNALLVFAEHRYMGESTPMTEGVQNCMGYDSMSECRDCARQGGEGAKAESDKRGGGLSRTARSRATLSRTTSRSNPLWVPKR